jgi:orotidine-5'-phosphate decarboxylase
VTRQTKTVSSQAMRERAMGVSLRFVADTTTPGFADRLVARVAERESQIVLGIDPDPMALWDAAAEGFAGEGSPAERTARAVLAHCRALIEAAGPACVAVKPQLAFFERLGAPGIAVLADVIAAAHDGGLIVIADGKRGDISTSAVGYAQALAGVTPSPAGDVTGLGVDAFTANPLLGVDSLEPLVATRAGVFVLVRTSNPGAADFQDLELAAGGPLWEQIARVVAGLGVVGASGFSDVGAVVGTTVPGHLERARELMTQTIFLLPGVGVQGGRVEDLAPAFAPGRAAGLVSASRSIADARDSVGGDAPGAARSEAERLRSLAWSLG